MSMNNEMNMKVQQYQVDAFTDKLFSGNPAAVCPLKQWLDERLMQAIAEENNLSETAFFVPTNRGFELRWFTPRAEVDLCGHATLATAYVIYEVFDYKQDSIVFTTRSGKLRVTREDGLLCMDFPSLPAKPQEPPPALSEALGWPGTEVLAADDYLVVYDEQSTVEALSPDFNRLLELDRRGVIVTAPAVADDIDFVSRFFAPKYGIPEDPVTGSTHCTLAPYWSKRLGKKRLTASQVSKRGGRLYCEVRKEDFEVRKEKVRIAGNAVLFSSALFEVPEYLNKPDYMSNIYNSPVLH